MNTKNAWKKALQQLQTEIPKAQFDTWVRDAKLIAFEEGRVSIGVRNAYARDWLAERLGDKIAQTLTEIVNQDVDVRFVLAGGQPVAEPVEQEEQPSKPDIVIQAEAYETVYEQVVLPHRQVVLPGYFRRHLRAIGPKIAWMYLAFRQLAYQHGARTDISTGTYSGKQIAALCGISDRTFWRRIKKEKTWNALEGLVTYREAEPQWQDGEEPRRLPLQYQVAMTLPLTGADARSLTFWLRDNVEEYDDPEGVVEAACQLSLQDLIPLDAKADGWQPMSVRDVVYHLFSGALPESQLETLASMLQNHIMPPKQDTIHVTLYFMENVLPHLSAGEAWLLTLLRDRCYVNRDTGEVRNTVKIKGGYKEMAGWLGVKSRTIGDWVRDKSSVFSVFVQCQESKIRTKHIFDVLLEDIPQELITIAMNEDYHEPFQTATQAILDGEDPEQVWEKLETKYANVSIDIRDLQTLCTRSSVSSYANVSIESTRLSVSIYATVIVKITSLTSLKPPHNLLNTSTTTTTMTNAPIASGGMPETGNKKTVVVGDLWDFLVIFQRFPINSSTKKRLKENKASPHAFVSHLLYAISPSGQGINSPLAYTLSELKANPHMGAGEHFDRLAMLPPRELWHLFQEGFKNKGLRTTGNADWDSAMLGSRLARLNGLAEQLFGQALTDKKVHKIIIREELT
ncbi:MAG: DnaA N-terminal domain-containing protein [Chloroflexota bacterium]|nr:DnaA N-terminal domain-containing protein [Chloroflexota bacterium]